MTLDKPRKTDLISRGLQLSREQTKKNSETECVTIIGIEESTRTNDWPTA
uniref:Uncharacterized protein n=1 Tax=Arion vulgaris TaxID=1028688 RepID=A0A0B7BLV9_9EUPU